MAEGNKSRRILVLGAAGRLGYVAATAFRDAGWTVRGLVRPGRTGAVPRGVAPIEAVTRDEAVKAGEDCDVVLNALNPAITKWQQNALSLAYGAIAAGGTERRDAAVSGQRLELRPRHAAGHRRNDTDGCHHPQGPDADRDGAAHPRGLRSRHAGDHFARRRLFRRRPRLVARPGHPEGTVARSPDLSGTARCGACLGLSAGLRRNHGTTDGQARPVRSL